MKRAVSFCLALAVLIGMQVWGEGKKEAGAEAIRVGFYGPLSGPMSLSGNASKQGAELAVKQINAKGGVLGRPLTLISYDDKSSPEQAVKVVTRMIDADKVQVIVGSLHSGNILAQGRVNEAGKIPQIGIGTSPVWLQQGYKYLFRPLPNTHVINVQIAKTIKELGYKKVGALGRADEYGKVGCDDIGSQLKPLGIELVVDWFQPGDTDFTGQLSKLVNSGMQAMIAFGVDVDQGPIVKQARRAGFGGLIFGPESLSVPSVLEVAGRDADGCVFGTAYIIPEKPEQAISKLEKDFFTAFVAEFGKMPDSQVAMRCYDAVNLLARAIEMVKTTDGPKVRDALQGIHGVEGLAGVFDFRGGAGEGIHEARMFAVKNGKYLLLKDYLKQEKK